MKGRNRNCASGWMPGATAIACLIEEHRFRGFNLVDADSVAESFQARISESAEPSKCRHTTLLEVRVCPCA